MAKKRKRGRPRKDEYIEEEESHLSLSDETKRSIVVIFLLVLAVLMFLSMFDLAGQFGVWIVKGMRVLLGSGYGILPFLVAASGVMLISERYRLRTINYIGLALLVLGYAGLFHIRIPAVESKAAVLAGQGGGYIGYFVEYPLVQIMDFWATLIILIALVLTGIFLGFNISIQDIRARGSQTVNLWSRLTSWMFMAFNKDAIAEAIDEDEEYEEDDDDAYEDEEEDEYAEDTDDEEEEEDEEASAEGDAAAAPEGQRVLTSTQRVNIALPTRLLQATATKPTSGDVQTIKEKIRQTFEHFNIEVEMGEVSVGPTVTQYTLKPAEGIKLSKIVGLNNDLALALATHPIRIEAPIPGKSLVGIEVPNEGIATVSLREVIDSKEFKQQSSALPVALGKDVAGKVWTVSLDKLPHLLIAGATGSGKSVCINSLIVSLLYANNPDELKFIMVDPKRVELSLYNGIPYLLTPVITDTQKTINALRWVVGEMDQRYQTLSEVGKRNIADYNKVHPNKRLPYIVVIIDELADLMAVAAQEVEGAIVRLAQMARAVGIHLVLATQRPSVDVITGLIKANVTSRIAFAVASQTDSRTILDMSGAEKLLGRGDMLLTTAEIAKPKRLQGAFVSDDEVGRITAYIKKQVKEVEYHEEIVKPKTSSGLAGDVGGDADPLLLEARRLVIEAGKASASYLQRRLRIGYSRAARLLDFLEEEGTIGPAEGSKPRKVLVEAQDYSDEPEVAQVNEIPEYDEVEESESLEEEYDEPDEDNGEYEEEEDEYEDDDEEYEESDEDEEYEDEDAEDEEEKY